MFRIIQRQVSHSHVPRLIRLSPVQKEIDQLRFEIEETNRIVKKIRDELNDLQQQMLKK